MAGELSGVTNLLMQWILSPFIWIAVIFIILAVTIGALMIRKKKKLVYPCLEVVDLGNDKCGYNLLKCGYFGKKAYLKGLIDRGEEVLKTETGETIYDFSTQDFQEVNGKRGVICARDSVNQNVLVPLSKSKIAGKNLLLEIAPAEFRDVALELIRDAKEETKDKIQQIMQWVMIGGVIIFALVAVIVIAQMVKQGQQDAGKLIIDAGNVCTEKCKMLFSQMSGQASEVAP